MAGNTVGVTYNAAGFYAHPTATVDTGARIGAGTKIWHYCHVSDDAAIGEQCVLGQNVFVAPHVRIGSGVRIQNNVSVYQGVTLEDNVFCGPSMVFTNVLNPRAEVARKDEYTPTIVKRGATLGANCTVLCGITISEYAFIAAGAVVTRNVPAYALMMGSPAKRTGWICACGVKLGSELKCVCGRSYKLPASGRLEPAA